jgi:multidrug resistance protein
MSTPDSFTDPGSETGGASRSVLLIVFTTILIDFIGFSVLIPVLPLYAERLGASPVQVALILTLYALAQLLFLPAWGWVSDRVGRRPVILVSLLGTVCSFLVLSVADTVETIYLARVLAGFFAASIGTAQAVVTDVTPPADRARGMGMIGAAFGAGMIVGPMLGGLAAQVGEKIPFYAVAILALVNFVVACLRLPESRPSGLRKPGWLELRRSLVPTPLRLIAAVHDTRIGLFLYLFFHLFTAFAVLEALITLYVGVEFSKSTFDVGVLFAWIGIVLFVTQGLLLRRLVSHLGERRLIEIGLVAMAVGLAGVAAVPSYPWFFVAGSIIAFGNGVTFPSFTSLYSKACQAENAGELLGQSQAMATTGRIVGPVCGGFLMQEWAPGAPFVVAGAMMFLALAIFEAFRATLSVDDDPGT